MVSDLGAVARLARSAPAQLDRLLELGEEIASIGRRVLAIAERLDERADAIMTLGERLDARAAELVAMGSDMRDLGDRIDSRGGEIVTTANRVVQTGSELIAVLPAFERALEMATPLEGAIDRFGRLVDRLPGGSLRRREAQREAGEAQRGQTDAQREVPETDQVPDAVPDADASSGREPTDPTDPRPSN